MTFHDLTRRGTHLLSSNSPAILTAIGVTGTITTAYLAGKASFKAGEIIANEQDRLDKETTLEQARMLEPKEMLVLVWKEYIPAIGTGVVTITCIILANRIGMRRAAAVAAAYSISERAFAEYKEKVVEHIGKNKEQKVRDEIAQDRVTNNPPGRSEIIITGTGEVLFLDLYSDRYFQSTMETVKKAMNDVNYAILNHNYASLSDFYNKVGLSPTGFSDDVGWNTDKILDLQFSTAMTNDDRPCITIDFRVAPIRNFFRGHISGS